MPAAMEGPLKKRGAKMPVMHDRYCVATWETDQALNKYLLLRSFKSHKSYLANAHKPLSACTLKGFGDWDGKGNFRRYDHAFLMETREGQVFLCAASSAAEKTQWLEFMSNAAAASLSRSRPSTPTSLSMSRPTTPTMRSVDSALERKPSASHGGGGLQLNKRLSMRFMTQALQSQASDAKTAHGSEEGEMDAHASVNDDADANGSNSSYDSEVRSTTSDEFSLDSLDEHLGLCDCPTTSFEPRRIVRSSNHDEHADASHSTLRVSNEDTSEALADASVCVRPAATDNNGLSDVIDGNDARMSSPFITPVEAPTHTIVAAAQVAIEATAATQEPTPTLRSVSSLHSSSFTWTRNVETSVLPSASIADATTPTRAIDHNAAMSTTPASAATVPATAALLPLPKTNPEVERASFGATTAQLDALGAADAVLDEEKAPANEAAPLIPLTIVAPVASPTPTPCPSDPIESIESVAPTDSANAVAPAAAAAVPTADSSVPNTPTLPLAEEARGSLSLPPVLAVRTVGLTSMQSEPSTLTARVVHSPLPMQRAVSATPLELGTSSFSITTSSSIDSDDTSDHSSNSPSPRRTRGRANSSVVAQSFEPFGSPTRVRRYSFSAALAPVRASRAFVIGSPLKQSFSQPHLGYVHSGLSTMGPSYPGLLRTNLSRQQSVDELDEFRDSRCSDDGDLDARNKTLSTSTDIDEV